MFTYEYAVVTIAPNVERDTLVTRLRERLGREPTEDEIVRERDDERRRNPPRTIRIPPAPKIGL